MSEVRPEHPAATAQPQNAKDCLPCRLTGAAAFGGVGVYAVYQGQQQGAFKRIRPPGGPIVRGQISVAIGVVMIGLGLGRLVI